MRDLDLSEVYKYIEPGPVVLLATSRSGVDNVMTMSWHLMMDFNPPIIGCVVSNGDYSFNALKKNGECVIAVPTVKMAKTVVAIGNMHGDELDKFKELSIKKSKAKSIEAPLLDDCLVNLECKVIDSSLVNKYCFFVLEVQKAWVNTKINDTRTIHHMGHGKFSVDGEIITLPSKMA
jgi:flavin reductase (DIM6/NTAB) family NADH-FMN oxidoreductase RutF